jgi:hypothetical protein
MTQLLHIPKIIFVVSCTLTISSIECPKSLSFSQPILWKELIYFSGYFADKDLKDRVQEENLESYVRNFDHPASDAPLTQ